MISDFTLLRCRAGFTVPELATQVGVTERTIYRWESGEVKPKALAVRWLEERIAKPVQGQGNAGFRFIDLFAGIGGLRTAFEDEVVGGRCVFTSEWDKYAQLTYQANHRDNRPINGDITKIDVDDIPAHDVLLAGFPCQPFSIAGVSKKNALGRAHGFLDETQGTLFFDVARILKAHRPAAFLLENVKNLTSHDKGRTFEVIRRTLTEDLGYQVEFRVINAKHFLPQHRERIVIVGFREATGFSWDDLSLPQIGVRTMSSILHPEDGSEVPEGRHRGSCERKVHTHRSSLEIPAGLCRQA